MIEKITNRTVRFSNCYEVSLPNGGSALCFNARDAKLVEKALAETDSIRARKDSK